MSRTGLWCIVPAAGRGRRFGGDVAKQHVNFGGRSLLGWTLHALASNHRIAGVVVVVAEGDDAWQSATSNIAGIEILSAIGGKERADSVLAGLHVLPESVDADDFVLVHDAARPCVSNKDIDALIDLASNGDGGLLAAPLRDTLKRADDVGYVLATEPRESLWRALTPQLFRRGALSAALRSARDAGIVVTDEAMAMERAGYKPRLIEGSDNNIKVTMASDLEIVQFLLRRR